MCGIHGIFQLVQCGLFDSIYCFKMNKKCLGSVHSDAFDIGKFRPQSLFAAFVSVFSNSESMRLIAQLLYELQRLASFV